jgi:cell division protease FtsH
MAPQRDDSHQLDMRPVNPQNQGEKPGPPQMKQSSARVFWWLVMIALLIWNIMTFWPYGKTKVSIPYTTFLAQVGAGNVTKVHISGSDITGTFATPIEWPPPKSTKPAEPMTAQSKESGPVTGTKPAEKPVPPPEAPKPAKYSAFQVTFPEAIGDPSLMALLESHNVVVDVEPPPSNWLMFLITDGLPILLLVGLFVWMGRVAMRNQAGVFSFGRSRARRYGVENPRVTFSDVAGVAEAKAQLQEEVDFLRFPQKYHELGARIPRGVLLVGQPGTGKTLLARAVAGEANVPFFSISASEFVEMFVGVGASRVRDLFTQAKVSSPAIVFIDELDAVGRRRGAGLGQTNDEREQTLNQLLVEMDGFDERNEVIVLAATNRPDVLDPALLRPGRFDRQVVVGLPDREARQDILKIHTRGLRLAKDVDLAIVARGTIGLSGADLANLCNEAALLAARHGRNSVTREDFDEALDKIMLGEALPKLRDDGERTTVAYHESGHALVAWYQPAADPVHKVTIIPHGRALGVTEQLPLEDQRNYARNYLLARIAVMLGGRASEEIVLEEITTGAENDLVEATRLARRMVTRWGMGSLGLAAFKADEEHPFLGYELSQGRDFSEKTASLIDAEVQRILNDGIETARNILKSRRRELDSLVQELLKSESASQEDLVRILGPRPEAPSPPSQPHALPQENSGEELVAALEDVGNGHHWDADERR